MIYKLNHLRVPRSSDTNATEKALIPAVSAEETAITPSMVQNKGCCPQGSTDANKQAAKLAQRKVINWVVVKYADAQSNFKKENKLSIKRIILEAGTREKLVERAIAKFNIKVDSDVSRHHNRIKVERLEA